eukprot:2948514-Amphidinium_carterae.1
MGWFHAYPERIISSVDGSEASMCGFEYVIKGAPDMHTDLKDKCQPSHQQHDTVRYFPEIIADINVLGNHCGSAWHPATIPALSHTHPLHPLAVNFRGLMSADKKAHVFVTHIYDESKTYLPVEYRKDSLQSKCEANPALQIMVGIQRANGGSHV